MNPSEFQTNALLGTACFNILISLVLAWVSAFVIYGKVEWLKRRIAAPRQLVRAHIDFLMMTFLLGFAHYIIQGVDLSIPDWVIVLFCVGAVYNPSGFIVLAFAPQKANPQSTFEKVLLHAGFIPVTLGAAWVAVVFLISRFA